MEAPDTDDDLLAGLFAPEEAKAFVLRHVRPANNATEEAVETLRRKLGQRNGSGNKRALCGFLWACQTLERRASGLLAFPSAKPNYDADGGGYKAFMSVKKALLDHGYITLARKAAADHGRATIYRLINAPDTTGLAFEETVPATIWLVQVKRAKDKYGKHSVDSGSDKSPPMRPREMEKRFGPDRIAEENAKVRRIVDYLGDYPLTMGDTSFRSLRRIFNDNSLERGGRLYGEYSSLPKVLRRTATLDGQPIAQLDIKASYLCIRAGMAGYQFDEESDPYQQVPWVDPNDPRTRKFAKQLISTLISTGGDKKRLPSALKAEYSDIIKPRQTITDFKAPIHAMFPFLLQHVDGLEVMFRESEMMMGVLHSCIDRDLPAWPLHDCIIVRQQDTTAATEILKTTFNEYFGFRPTITLNDDGAL
jgi:hypothetical protein